jgi:hypothetical protein
MIFEFLAAMNMTIAFLILSSLVDGSNISEERVESGKKGFRIRTPIFPSPVYRYVLKMEAAYLFETLVPI